VSEKIVNTELGLDDLFLEVSWEERSDLIGEGVSVVQLDVTAEVELCWARHNLEFQSVRIADQIGHDVVVGLPAVFYFVGVVYPDVIVDVAVSRFFDFFEFVFLNNVFQIGIFSSLIALVFEVNLGFYVGFLYIMLHLNSFFEDVEAPLHRQPF